MLIKKMTVALASGLLVFNPIAAHASAAQVQHPMMQLMGLTQAMSMMANPCASGMAGCVLPLKQAPAVAQPTPPQTPVVEQAATAVAEEEKGGIGFLPILLGLAAVAGGIFLLTDNEDDAPVSP